METDKQSLKRPGGLSDQHARFIEAARELGADEGEATFKAKLAAIARQKPKTPVPLSSDAEP